VKDEKWREAWEIYEAMGESPAEQSDAALAPTVDPEIAACIRLVLSSESSAEEEVQFPEIGAKIGRFVLKAVVGRGGAGLVYSAEDVELGRTVAIKFLLPRSGLTGQQAEHFVREAEATSLLNHPNIVTVHEVIRSELGTGIVMEMVEGVSLRQFCRSPLSMAQAVHLGRQMAEALAAAHGRNIIHRDIKPENIMVRPDGYVKIVDFGLARIAPVSRVRGGGAVIHTIGGGTWRYMSPEQARGEPLTAATDVFSLGLVFYEMCTGTHPFPNLLAVPESDVMAARRVDAPSERNPKVPQALSRLILRMLEQRPEERPTAEDVVRALESSLERVAATKERTRGRRQLIAAVVFLLCLRVAVVLWQHWAAARQPVLTRVTNNESENRVTAAAISSDGTMLAYSDPDGILVGDITGTEAHALRSPPHLGVDRIAWFPDGAKLLISAFDTSTLQPSLWVIPTSDGIPAMLRANARNGVPSPDGRRIAFTANNQSEIWVADARGGRAKTLITGALGDTFLELFWSPDGKRISFLHRRYRPRDPRASTVPDEFEGIYETSYESADVISGKVLARSPDTLMKSACALPDGRVLYERWGEPGDRWSENVWEIQSNPETGALTGRPRQLTHLGTSTRVFALSRSSNGKKIAAIIESDEADAYVGDLDQSGRRLVDARRLTFNSKVDYPHAWTPDSESVIFESDRSGNFDLFKQSITSRIAETIVKGPDNEFIPKATPDGRWLLYASGYLWARWALMRVPLGGGAPQKVFETADKSQFRCPLYGPGHCLLREAIEHKEFIFYELDAIRGKGREVARTPWMANYLDDWDISPDGSTVALPYHDTPQGRIRLVHLDGRPETDLTVQGFGPLRSVTWTARGDGWFGAVPTRVGDILIYIDTRGNGTLLHQTKGQTWAVPSPDTHHLAFVDYGVDSNVWMLEHF
jgi:eukaryotic-like serine/threonine-protein kinase